MASPRSFLVYGALATVAILLLASTTTADYYRAKNPYPTPSPPLPEPSYNQPWQPVNPPTTPTPTPPTHTVPKPPPTTPNTYRPDSLKGQFLASQNAARLRVGVSPFVWDTKLEHYAMWWAEQRRSDCSLTHSNGPYGENIFWGSGDGYTAAQAAQSWVDEASSYDYNSNSCRGGMCGHYTQIVWRDTLRIGCARVVCYNGRGVFITCNYDPPGNYIGEKPY